MFEKEAEEWWYNEYSPSLYDNVSEVWQKGAKFGYNKCKEELNQKGLALQSDMDKTIEQNIALKKELNKDNEWHYVKDGYYPKDNNNVLVLLKDKIIQVDYYFSKIGWNISVNADVIAWKEIVLPKESE